MAAGLALRSGETEGTKGVGAASDHGPVPVRSPANQSAPWRNPFGARPAWPGRRAGSKGQQLGLGGSGVLSGSTRFSWMDSGLARSAALVPETSPSLRVCSEALQGPGRQRLDILSPSQTSSLQG